MHRKTLLGLAGILGIWITAGLALPFVNVLTMFTPTQLMAFRGFLTATMAFTLLRGRIGRLDTYTYLLAVTLPFATLGLFQGIRHWGAGPTVIIITATPIVNVLIGLRIGRRLSRASFVGLVLMLGGVVMARWGGHFNWAGFAWSVFGTIMNGILYEFFPRALPVHLKDSWDEKIRKNLAKCFCASVGMGVVGFLGSFGESWSPIMNSRVVFNILGFAFVGGFLYWLGNLLAFENLPTNEASVLAQGETPAVLLGAWVVLGEHLTFVQLLGVSIALYGAWYLSQWLATHPEASAPAEAGA